MQDLEENHEKWSESGPHGSVRADNLLESILRGLGSLWDTSRTPKRKQINKKTQVFGVFVAISSYSPIVAVRCRAAPPVHFTLVAHWAVSKSSVATWGLRRPSDKELWAYINS